MIKKYRKEIIFFYSVSALFLIIASFCDLQIDISLNSPANPYAVWFYKTGELPSRLICPLAGAVLLLFCKKKISKAVGFFVNIGGSAYLGYYTAKYFGTDTNRILFIAAGIIFGFAVMIALKAIKLSDKTKKILCIFAAMGIAVMAVQLITVDIMKNVWGRVRFRDLIAVGSYDDFTNWYIVNGKNGNKSFPSGHTAGASMFFLTMLFPLLSDKLKKYSSLFFLIPFVYTVNIAVTRLVMGAHYLSDVTVGGIIGFTCVIFAIALCDKKYFGNKPIKIKGSAARS